MNKVLEALIESARNHVMTDEERDAQRQSFVRGQLALMEPRRIYGTPSEADRALCRFLDLHATADPEIIAGHRENAERAERDRVLSEIEGISEPRLEGGNWHLDVDPRELAALIKGMRGKS